LPEVHARLENVTRCDVYAGIYLALIQKKKELKSNTSEKERSIIKEPGEKALALKLSVFLISICPAFVDYRRLQTW
jgi:hypothetical protein